ncbi:MAG: L-threonylcarbamoyladenylate synthase [Bacillota bacterium]
MEIVRLNQGNLVGAVRLAADILTRGGIVLYPTDTLYGLAVDATNRSALQKLRELKGREKKKPISVVVGDMAGIEAHAEMDSVARHFAKQHLPGALTLVLPGKEHLPEELMLNGAIGIRIPDDPFALALARTFNKPFTATSANRSGLPTAAHPDEIIRQFGSLMPYIDLVIDAGERTSSPGSTVMAFRNGEAVILREGIIPREKLLGI